MRKIKILVDGRWFDSYYSGVTTYLKGLYNAIAQDEKFDVTVIGSDIVKLKNEFPVNVSFIELRSNSNFKRLYFDLPKIIERNDFDYAHFQYICPIIKSCKYIVTLHDLLFLDFKKSFPLSFILKNTFLFYISAIRSDMLLTVSEFSRKHIARHFRINENNIHVTPNGILECFSDITDVKDIRSKYDVDNYILFVSRLEPRKNHIMLLKAFVDLELYTKYHLIFIGKKTINVRDLDEYFAALPEQIQNKVLYIENVSEKDLRSFYSNAALFAYPSMSEGFGIPPIEAIASGTRTICSNATALADFDFMENFQFAPDNISEIKEKLLKALSDDSYPIERYKNIVNERYKWGRIADDFKRVIISDFQKTR